MQSSREGKICVVARVALLLWTAAHTMSASTLPGQHEDLYSVWALSVAEVAQAPSASSEAALAFDAAAATELLNSILITNLANSASPIEVSFDAGAAYAPPTEDHGPLRGAEPPTWMSVGVAAALLAGSSPRRHRRRTRTGHRHAAELVS